MTRLIDIMGRASLPMDLAHTEPKPFEHVHAPKSGLYRGVMRAFVDAKHRFLVHLRPEDVAEALGVASSDPVEDALASLVGWGNLRADPDTSRVTTVEDFYRPRYLYQLTREGEAAELALDTYDAALGRRGELQSVALEDIRLRLRSLLSYAEAPEPDAVVVHSLLRELTGLLDGLAANASAFMSGLQRTIDLQEGSEDAFIAYKERLVGYLERFIRDLVVKTADIAATLECLDGLSMDRLLTLVAAREAVDVAPGDDREQDAGAFDGKLADWRARWSGLRSWFVGDHAHPSQASLLRQRARAAIPALLSAVTVLVERRAGRSDRSADFRALAVWFAEAPTEAHAHRLWRVAFGLSAARHLGMDADTLAALERQTVPPATSWLAAPPVPINARLRATGQYQRRGMVARIVDRGDAKRLLAERLDAERRQTEEARRRLATGRPVRLSSLGVLDRDEFALFLGLLGDGLSAGPPGIDGIHTTTSDGTLEIRLVPTGDGQLAEIVAPDGLLRGPDHVITIVDLTAADRDLPAMAAGHA
jgi:uncharacterized protein (TIGR02677 family)